MLPFDQAVNTGWWGHSSDSGAGRLTPSASVSGGRVESSLCSLTVWLCPGQFTSLVAWVTVFETVQIPSGFEIVQFTLSAA